MNCGTCRNAKIAYDPRLKVAGYAICRLRPPWELNTAWAACRINPPQWTKK